MDVHLYHIPDMARLLHAGMSGANFFDFSCVRHLDLAVQPADAYSIFEAIVALQSSPGLLYTTIPLYI